MAMYGGEVESFTSHEDPKRGASAEASGALLSRYGRAVLSRYGKRSTPISPYHVGQKNYYPGEKIDEETPFAEQAIGKQHSI